mgnify:CR=1 FL=1
MHTHPYPDAVPVAALTTEDADFLRQRLTREQEILANIRADRATILDRLNSRDRVIATLAASVEQAQQLLDGANGQQQLTPLGEPQGQAQAFGLPETGTFIAPILCRCAEPMVNDSKIGWVHRFPDGGWEYADEQCHRVKTGDTQILPDVEPSS